MVDELIMLLVNGLKVVVEYLHLQNVLVLILLIVNEDSVGQLQFVFEMYISFIVHGDTNVNLLQDDYDELLEWEDVCDGHDLVLINILLQVID